MQKLIKYSKPSTDSCHFERRSHCHFNDPVLSLRHCSSRLSKADAKPHTMLFIPPVNAMTPTQDRESVLPASETCVAQFVPSKPFFKMLIELIGPRFVSKLILFKRKSISFACKLKVFARTSKYI
eukprot:Gb_18568 [translate_table: standard]